MVRIGNRMFEVNKWYEFRETCGNTLIKINDCYQVDKGSNIKIHFSSLKTLSSVIKGTTEESYIILSGASDAIDAVDFAKRFIPLSKFNDVLATELIGVIEDAPWEPVIGKVYNFYHGPDNIIDLGVLKSRDMETGLYQYSTLADDGTKVQRQSSRIQQVSSFLEGKELG